MITQSSAVSFGEEKRHLLRPRILHRLRFFVASLVLMASAGCVPVAIVGGVLYAGAKLSEERSIGQSIQDKAVDVRVNALLFDRSEPFFRDVKLEVFEGRVLMMGNVDTPQLKAEAIKLASGVSGVREVIDEIVTGQPTDASSLSRDKLIIAQLRGQLVADPNVMGVNYTIDAYQGVVYLVGIAQDQKELDLVTTHAATTSGVTKVVSHVLFRDDPRRPVSPQKSS